MGILTKRGRLERLEAKLKKEINGSRCIIIWYEDDRARMTENGEDVMIGPKETILRYLGEIRQKGAPIYCITVQVV